MKNKLTSAIKFAVIAVFLCCAGNVFAQNVPMVGGFKSASVTDKNVVYAADFAVKTIAKSENVDITYDSVLKAQYQVVQGMNYKLYVQSLFTTEDNEEFFMCVNAVVYRDLKNKYKLTKWEEVKCPAED
jgi:hypothetical protein